MAKEKELEAVVEKQLREAGVRFVKEPVVGDTRPDFLVTTDRGDQIVVEVKAWEPSPESTARASGPKVQGAVKGCSSVDRYFRRSGPSLGRGRSRSSLGLWCGPFRARRHAGAGGASAKGSRIAAFAQEEGLRIDALQWSVRRHISRRDSA